MSDSEYSTCGGTAGNTGSGEMQFICIQARENSLTQFGFADADAC